MSLDRKIVHWLMKGSIEFNSIQREIDLTLLKESLLPDYKSIFEKICEYQLRYKAPPSYEILCTDLLEDLDDIQLAQIISDEVVLENEYRYFIDKIRERYNIYLAKRFSELSNETIDIENFNKSLRQTSSKIDRLHKSAVFAEGDFTKSTEERLNNYKYVEENPGLISGVLTGYKEIDDYTWGIKKQELMVISASSSGGKSLLMMNIAINAWLGNNSPFLPLSEINNSGCNVLFFTLEMSKHQLEQRIDANMAGIPHKGISRGRLTDYEKERWAKSIEFQKNYHKKFYIVDMPRGSRILDVDARYDSIIAEFQPDLVCIDYLGIMKPNVPRNQGDWLDVGYVAEDMHEFCRNKNVPVITAAQRKALDKKNNLSYKKYRFSADLEDLGRSKMIGDNANIVLMIEKRQDEELKDDMEIVVAKNRDGAKGKLRLMKEFDKMKISNAPDDWTSDDGSENKV